jgi:hypothetical protein
MPSTNAICNPLLSFSDKMGDELIEIPRIQINMSEKNYESSFGDGQINCHHNVKQSGASAFCCS